MTASPPPQPPGNRIIQPRQCSPPHYQALVYCPSGISAYLAWNRETSIMVTIKPTDTDGIGKTLVSMEVSSFKDSEMTTTPDGRILHRQLLRRPFARHPLPALVKLRQ